MEVMDSCDPPKLDDLDASSPQLMPCQWWIRWRLSMACRDQQLNAVAGSEQRRFECQLLGSAAVFGVRCQPEAEAAQYVGRHHLDGQLRHCAAGATARFGAERQVGARRSTNAGTRHRQPVRVECLRLGVEAFVAVRRVRQHTHRAPGRNFVVA